jgi:hypothetical protein
MIFFKKNPDLTTICNLIGTNKKDEKACSRIVFALHAKQHKQKTLLIFQIAAELIVVIKRGYSII